MLDTILLCGNTRSDFDHSQPEGPANFMVAEDQWAWLEQTLASSKYDLFFINVILVKSRFGIRFIISVYYVYFTFTIPVL